LNRSEERKAQGRGPCGQNEKKISDIHEKFRFLPGLSMAIREIFALRPKEVVASYGAVKYPIHLRLKTSDMLTFVHVFLRGEYDVEIAKTPTIIVDAGANIGLTSIFYANKYPDAKIFSLEPECSNFALLKKNVAPYGNILAINKALWGDNTTLEILDPGLDKWGFQTRRRPDEKAAGKEAVESITIDRLMHDYQLGHIDILKIDIEGAEKEVCESAGPWIDKVGMMAMELHDRHKTGCSRSFYNATNGFDAEIHRGENVFVLKRSYMTKDMFTASLKRLG
jgi:FkbM family methyltransferase